MGWDCCDKTMIRRNAFVHQSVCLFSTFLLFSTTQTETAPSHPFYNLFQPEVVTQAAATPATRQGRNLGRGREESPPSHPLQTLFIRTGQSGRQHSLNDYQGQDMGTHSTALDTHSITDPVRLPFLMLAGVCRCWLSHVSSSTHSH